MTNPTSTLIQPLSGAMRYIRNPEKTSRQISIITTILVALVAIVFMTAAYQNSSSNASILAALYIMSVIGTLLTSMSLAISVCPSSIISLITSGQTNGLL